MSNERASGNGGGYLFPLVAVGVVLLFLAAPWPFALKAHAALHGLCAQTPSHTFMMGEQKLPFDARMTGIYGGFIVSFGWLLWRGRGRAAKLPTLPVLGSLALLVGVLAVDGFNSLLRDLGEWHPYTPDNRLRLVTGLCTGIALAAMIAYLLAVTLWRRPDTARAPLTGRDLLVLLPLQAPFALLVLSGAGWLYLPISLTLIVAAVTAVSSIALVMVVLLKRAENSAAGPRQLEPYAAVAVIVGVLAMAAISGARFALERALGMPPLT